jgi:outer membrane protein assembly factor BamB
VFRATVVAAGVALFLAGSAGAADWTRYGGDAQLTNDVPLATATAAGIDAATAPDLQQRWGVQVNGGLVASPLYLQGAGASLSMIYVATESGEVAALNANTGALIWKRQLPTYETDDCGTYGVSSTGVIDGARGVLYVADANGDVYALELNTGADAPNWPVRLPLDPTTGYVWGGLTLAGSTLYAPVASYCDEPAPLSGLFPTGGLTAIDVDGATVGASFAVSGPNTLGGIWGYGGTSVDPLTGDLWTASGNSEPLGAGETKGFAEAVVELDPALDVLAWNRPSGIPSETLDTDFGSTPLLFQPNGCPPLAAAHNKNGELYVWRRDALGAGPIWSIKIGPDDLAAPFLGEPSWSADLQSLIVSNARVYDDAAPSGVSDYAAVVELTIGPNCTFPSQPTWISDTGKGTKPPALIVGDAVFVAGGDATSFSVLDAHTGELLRAFYLSDTLYSSPILAGDEVVIGNSSGSVFAFATTVTPPVAPAARERHVRRPRTLRASG